MDTKADSIGILMVVFKPKLNVYLDWQCLHLRTQFEYSSTPLHSVFHSSTPFSHSSPMNSHTQTKLLIYYLPGLCNEIVKTEGAQSGFIGMTNTDAFVPWGGKAVVAR